MTTTEIPTTEATKPQPSNYVSTNEWISKMKLTFGNATLPTIFPAMEVVGYSAEKIAGLRNQLTELEGLQQLQTKEYAEQLAETEKFDIERAKIDAIFTKHRALAKILFKGNVNAMTALRIGEEKLRAYPGWAQQVSNFYAQLESTPALLTIVAGIGITSTVLATQKQALADLQILKESQRKETAEAQSATDTRDKAFDALYPLYSEYIQYAKVLLADNQALEAIGVKVKAK
ncbi:MAG: hypothetical protein ACOYMD_06750 [Paludibacter sp.]